ncbi:hypothetical protein PV797_17510 [Clostridiaceae bacterium M8S5]|nr:hypothetical protein PV797_17510 [Clostridiaceae bacterium M8S5]
MRNKKIKILIVTIIVLILLVAGLFFVGRKFEITGDYSRIDIQSGNTGEIVTIEDQKRIKDIIENLNHMKFKKHSFFIIPTMGYTYNVKFYNGETEKMQIIIKNKNEFTRRFFIYKSDDNIIKYLDSVFGD